VAFSLAAKNFSQGGFHVTHPDQSTWKLETLVGGVKNGWNSFWL